MVFNPHYNLMHDPAERYPSEVNYTGYSFGIGRMVQEHNKLIEKFPHTIQKPYQREPDEPFNPSKSWSYETRRQVDWE